MGSNILLCACLRYFYYVLASKVVLLGLMGLGIVENYRSFEGEVKLRFQHQALGSQK